MSKLLKSVGTIILGTGTDQQRTIQITDMLRCEFKDHRWATIAKCEEGSYLLSIENPGSTDRDTEEKMYLTEGSFIALLCTAHAFLKEKDIDFAKKLEEYNIQEGEVKFEYKFSEE